VHYWWRSRNRLRTNSSAFVRQCIEHETEPEETDEDSAVSITSIQLRARINDRPPESLSNATRNCSGNRDATHCNLAVRKDHDEDFANAIAHFPALSADLLDACVELDTGIMDIEHVLEYARVQQEKFSGSSGITYISGGERVDGDASGREGSWCSRIWCERLLAGCMDSCVEPPGEESTPRVSKFEAPAWSYVTHASTCLMFLL
jgi:hypothetical protein